MTSLRALTRMTSFCGIVLSVSACGTGKVQKENQRSSDEKSADSLRASNLQVLADESRLSKADNDQVLTTTVLHVSSDGEGGLSLTNASVATAGWNVDMETHTPIVGAVAPNKYLRVTGEPTVPLAAENRPYDIGCLTVELKDNVYYREKTWLRLASTGMYGTQYTEVNVPLSVDFGGWQNVPELEDSVTLQQFASDSLKSFRGQLCFRLDFTNAPAQKYEGEIIVQYLKPGTGTAPISCAQDPSHPSCQPSQDPTTTPPSQDDPSAPTVQFQCLVNPMVLSSKQSAEFAWSTLTGATIRYTLSSDSTALGQSLGSITELGGGKVRYTAPTAIPNAGRVLITARPEGVEVLPAVCIVNLAADSNIGVPDDGEVKGVTGNVYRLPANTPKLPDFTGMTPVSQVVVSNIDVPERAFSAGFPGVTDLFEWFGIRFRGRLIVPEAGEYEFQLISDDGSILYLDGSKVVDNDGLHYTATKSGKKTLTAGEHEFLLDYYQGPRYHITMQMTWRKVAPAGAPAAAFVIVPPSAFDRPLR